MNKEDRAITLKDIITVRDCMIERGIVFPSYSLHIHPKTAKELGLTHGQTVGIPPVVKVVIT